MKAVLFKDFKINARRIAEAMWGTGGTNATKTNRRGAYYYSCSAHGGYVVSGDCLTKEEKDKLHEYITPEHLNVVVQSRIDGDYVIGVSYANLQRIVGRKKNFQYNPSLGECEWKKIDVYAFEEDCNWAILEKLTDIKADCYGKDMTPERRKEIIDGTFNRWAKKIMPEGEILDLIKT